MFYILSKIVGFFINPIIWILGLLVAAVFLKKAKHKQTFLIVSAVLLYFFSNRFILNEVLVHWENHTESITLDTGTYDYGIVLGGMVWYDKSTGTMNFLQSSDRIWQTVRLYKEQKIKKIIISGGSADFFGQDTIESVLLKNFLVKIGLPANDILTEENSRNTHENALFTQQILSSEPNARLLLITSAIHMRRAKKCFEKVGLSCDNYATDFYSGNRKYNVSEILIPNPQTLFNWDAFIHELFGMASYKIARYI
jgi:uncharacterized SAM-binding protein YcdF (DUF218 family)